MQSRVWAICVALMMLASLTCAAQSGPPTLCKPCLFYGGDFDDNDQNSTLLYDENTGTYPESSTYGVLNLPPYHSLLVEGMLFQIQFYGTVKFDPNVVTWEIRTMVGDGTGGNLIASGHRVAVLEPTGRAGGTEYTVAIKLIPPVTLNGNTGYAFNLTPVCVNKHDQNCATNQYYVSNTTHQANNFRGFLQPPHAMVINSKAFGWYWKNWCNFLNLDACADLSFGIMGKVLQ